MYHSTEYAAGTLLGQECLRLPPYAEGGNIPSNCLDLAKTHLQHCARPNHGAADQRTGCTATANKLHHDIARSLAVHLAVQDCKIRKLVAPRPERRRLVTSSRPTR
ncbi:hypothetical protein GMOD_00008400 [Pyrenophora seminiperda CCB06]|uniref:Uncharacterized protein n=1 Tax=Pyrenophora seminiperda CCB06 TaxID=1302712 RepID=A0A3M7M8H6_9PLEO|nr:hypothetical protein GMOD_00008400 [Pyrenophora seminiperda CCB06]